MTVSNLLSFLHCYHSIGCINVDQRCKIDESYFGQCEWCKTWKTCADWCFLIGDDCQFWKFELDHDDEPTQCTAYTQCEVQPSGTTGGAVLMGDRSCHSSDVGCQQPKRECKGDKISTFAVTITVFPQGWKRCATSCYYTENCNYWQVRPKPKENDIYECDLFRRCTEVAANKANYILGEKSCNGIGK